MWWNSWSVQTLFFCFGAMQSLLPIKTCMERYILYETASNYYIVGCDALETYFRILKLNRSILKPKSLEEVLTEDPLVYQQEDLSLMLEMIHEGNKNSGGLTRVTVAYGLVGFVRFLDCYYFTLITQRRKVGCIGSNFIYAVKAAEVFAIRPRENAIDEYSIMKLWRTVNKKLSKTNTDQAESRYMGLFQFIDISKDFFFSYTYDLTHSLQHNFIMSSSNAFPPPPFKVKPCINPDQIKTITFLIQRKCTNGTNFKLKSSVLYWVI
jgi:phosphatidylinositol 3,5-bisphosphate 5-phosphatase